MPKYGLSLFVYGYKACAFSHISPVGVGHFSWPVDYASHDSSDDPLVGLLSVLLSSSMALERRKEILGSRYGIAMDKELEEEVIEMCNLSKAVEDIGRRKGLREGFLMSLFQLVDEGDLTLEKAAKKAGMTIEDFLEKKREYNK